MTTDDQIDSSILGFLKHEALRGCLESTPPDIAKGTSLSYNQVGRALERLRMKGDVGYRERGTDRKSVRYYYLTDILKLCQEKWKA